MESGAATDDPCQYADEKQGSEKNTGQLEGNRCSRRIDSESHYGAGDSEESEDHHPSDHVLNMAREGPMQVSDSIGHLFTPVWIIAQLFQDDRIRSHRRGEYLEDLVTSMLVFFYRGPDEKKDFDEYRRRRRGVPGYFAGECPLGPTATATSSGQPSPACGNTASATT